MPVSIKEEDRNTLCELLEQAYEKAATDGTPGGIGRFPRNFSFTVEGDEQIQITALSEVFYPAKTMSAYGPRFKGNGWYKERRSCDAIIMIKPRDPRMARFVVVKPSPTDGIYIQRIRVPSI